VLHIIRVTKNMGMRCCFPGNKGGRRVKIATHGAEVKNPRSNTPMSSIAGLLHRFKGKFTLILIWGGGEEGIERELRN
jgi:hypothetical protein